MTASVAADCQPLYHFAFNSSAFMWTERLEELRHLQDKFLKQIRSVDDKTAVQEDVFGSWSLKQLVDHLTGWEWEIVRQYESFRNGGAPVVDHDIGTFNERSVLERADLSWIETVQEYSRAKSTFQETAAALRPSLVLEQEDILEWVDVQIDHYKHHLDQLHEFE